MVSRAGEQPRIHQRYRHHQELVRRMRIQRRNRSPQLREMRLRQDSVLNLMTTLECQGQVIGKSC